MLVTLTSPMLMLKAFAVSEAISWSSTLSAEALTPTCTQASVSLARNSGYKAAKICRSL